MSLVGGGVVPSFSGLLRFCQSVRMGADPFSSDAVTNHDRTPVRPDESRGATASAI